MVCSSLPLAPRSQVSGSPTEIYTAFPNSGADQKEIIIQGNEGVLERVLPCFRQSLDDSSPGLNIQL